MKKWKRFLIVISALGMVNFIAWNVKADVIYQVPKNIEKHSTKTSTASAHVPIEVVSSTIPKPVPIPLPDHSYSAFRVGERLQFVIKYEFVSAGKATMAVNEGPLINGRPTLHLESKAESNKVIDKIFKVRDFNSSTVDKASLASLFFHQNLKEGGYHVIRNTTLDYQSRVYYFERTKKGKTTSSTGKVERPLQDILSAFFFTRTLPLELGKEYDIIVFSDEDVYPLKVKVYPKIQEIKVPAGKFQCIRIEPTIVSDAIFKAKEGRMTIWLTNDERKMPVLLRSKVMLGAFDAELEEYTTGK